MTAQLRQGSESTRGSHNVAYRGLRLADETLLSPRDHLLSAPCQPRFDARHRTGPPDRPAAGVTATLDEVDEQVTD